MKVLSLIHNWIHRKVGEYRNSNIIIILFLIFGILLTLQSFFFNEIDNVNSTEDYSGILGYYVFMVLNQLFGVISFVIGPIMIFISLKSYIKQNLEYIYKGLTGIFLLLFSISVFIGIYDPIKSGFLGIMILDVAYMLLGKKGTWIVFLILVIISFSRVFFITIDDVKKIFVDFKNHKEQFNWKKIITYIFLFFSLKSILDIFKNYKKNQTENTEANEENMNLKSFIFRKKDKKLPWIQKLEITEEEFPLISNKVSENQIQESEDSFELEHRDFNFNLELDSANKEDSFIIEENHQFLKEFRNTSLKNSESTNLKIMFDEEKNRYLFISEEVKKKLNIDKKNLLIDLNIDDEITQKLEDKFHKEVQIQVKLPETQVEESIPIIDSSEVTRSEFLEEDQKNEEENPIIIEEKKAQDFFQNLGTIQDHKKDISEIQISLSEISHKKLSELQEQIISSEKLNFSYQLSLKNLKIENKNQSQRGISVQQEIQENWQKLEKVLSDYGIKGRVVGATRGPMITMFEVQLEPGVRVNRVQSLQDEICMNLASVSVRILAPIPGKSTIGIEIPNKNREFVSLGDLVHKDPEFFTKKREINIPLGKDVFGKTRYIDLTRLPHLLIAGTTGSGKSVFINSIIASLLYQYSPEMVRFLMIDPKMVELKLYEGIPHLLYPVIIDVKMASKALNWAVEEMENRYRLFSLTKCRDIRSYNEKINKNQISGNYVPYIVIFIDELSDLMMVSAKEVEDSIIRLTQKARAVGIHMILATQRPSVDVITALIKANCPARISFQVSQKVDSRIILDTSGAETLLGKGDLLYKSPASTLPVRIQSPFITEEEIENIVKETQKYPFYGFIDLPEDDNLSTDFGLNDLDEQLIQKAWQIILESGKTSTSFIQRKLRIGYNRAATIMEKLEEMGYLSPAYGSKPREILKRN